MSLFWLSFCDPHLPTGTQFLGALIVDGEAGYAFPVPGNPLAIPVVDHDGFLDAVANARQRGLNPGGECVGHPIPADIAARVPVEWRERLLTREECGELDKIMTGVS